MAPLMSKLLRRPLELLARSPVLGMLLAFLFIAGAIALGTRSLLALFSIEGLVIVIGGVVAVAYMSFEAEDVRIALTAVVAMFRERRRRPADDLHRDMAAIIAWASMVKEMGMRRLEWSLAKQGIVDPFVKYGLNMVVTGYAPDDVRAMMETAADATFDRECAPVEVLQSMTSHAPAFGMIGTLVGMVAMLSSLDADFAGIGSSLSVAFLSTLYGVISARMVYMPAAAKLRQAAARHRFRNQLVTEGMVLLVRGETPIYIQDRLNSFLRPERHDYLDQFKFVPRPVLEPPQLRVVGA